MDGRFHAPSDREAPHRRLVSPRAFMHPLAYDPRLQDIQRPDSGGSNGNSAPTSSPLKRRRRRKASANSLMMLGRSRSTSIRAFQRNPFGSRSVQFRFSRRNAVLMTSVSASAFASP
jgi:hypothetical protein